MTNIALYNTTSFIPRFGETDAMGVVWHGNYIKYFEDGRESFGEQFDLRYLDFYDNNLLTPIVKITCDYKKPLVYGDKGVVITEFKNTPAAKIIFQYKILNAADNALVAEGHTEQVFINKEGTLQLTNPDFYQRWKKKHNLL